MNAADRIAALVAFAVFAGFFGVVVVSVRHPALIVVCLLGIALAGYDLWRQMRRRNV